MKKNNVMVIAIIFDPKFKMRYMYYFIARRFREPPGVGRSRTNACRSRGMFFGFNGLTLHFSLIDGWAASVYNVSFGPNDRKKGWRHSVIRLDYFRLVPFRFGPTIMRETKAPSCSLLRTHCRCVWDISQFLDYPSLCHRYMLGRLPASNTVVVAVQLRSLAKVLYIPHSFPFLHFAYWVLYCLTLLCRPSASPMPCLRHGLLCRGGSSCSGAYWF